MRLRKNAYKSFLIRTSPSFGSGTGRSVWYSRTSVPPVLEMEMPFIVFGIEAMVLVVVWKCCVRVRARVRVMLVLDANGRALDNDMQLCLCCCNNHDTIVLPRKQTIRFRS